MDIRQVFVKKDLGLTVDRSLVRSMSYADRGPDFNCQLDGIYLTLRIHLLFGKHFKSAVLPTTNGPIEYRTANETALYLLVLSPPRSNDRHAQ